MAFLVSIIKPLAYLSVPIIFLRTITSSSPTGRYCVNVGIYVGTIVLVSAWGAAVGIVMFVARQRFDLGHHISRTFYAIASRLFSIQVEIEGEEYFDTRPAVLMANHQSMLDVLVLGR
jgi:lysophosphatidate acyltransferase